MISEHRRVSGLSRAELARLAGVGKTVIFDLEHGKETVRYETLMKVLSALNITVQFHSPLMEPPFADGEATETRTS
jgi:transcriptional regulator with XRE-family HTH domain